MRAGEVVEDRACNRVEKLAATRAAIEEAEARLFVSEKAMNEWVSSWGSLREMPAPEPDLPPTA